MNSIFPVFMFGHDIDVAKIQDCLFIFLINNHKKAFISEDLSKNDSYFLMILYPMAAIKMLIRGLIRLKKQ